MEIKIKRSKLQATISFTRKEGGTWVDMIIVALRLCLFVALSCIDDVVAISNQSNCCDKVACQTQITLIVMKQKRMQKNISNIT
mgnify:CR=1 FL=1